MIVNSNPLKDLVGIEVIVKETNIEAKDSGKEANGTLRKDIKMVTKKKETSKEEVKNGANNIDNLNNKEDNIKDLFNGEEIIKEINKVNAKFTTDGAMEKMVNRKMKIDQLTKKEVGEDKIKVIMKEETKVEMVNSKIDNTKVNKMKMGQSYLTIMVQLKEVNQPLQLVHKLQLISSQLHPLILLHNLDLTHWLTMLKNITAIIKNQDKTINFIINSATKMEIIM